jgi:hypothetical protein
MIVDEEDLYIMQNTNVAHNRKLYEPGARFYKTRL